jgi:hypothetical protein
MTTTFTVNNHPSNQTKVVNGMCFKPNTMAQGSMFSNARMCYVREAGGGKTWNSSSDYTSLKRIVATGKSSLNIPGGQTMSFSGPDQTSVKTAVARCRGGGTVAPKKKGGYR